MKVPDNLMYSVFQFQDERIKKKLTEKTIEIATGKRVKDISDDPEATFNILNIKKDISELSQFSKNRLFADVNLSYIDYALGKMSDRVKEIYTKVVQAKNLDNTSDELKSIGKEVEEALSFLLDRANEKVGENYIFSGTALTTKPFDSNFNYLGSDEDFLVQLDEDSFVEVFRSGGKIFDTNVYQLDASFSSADADLGVSGTMTVSYNSTNVSVDYGRGIWYLASKVSDPDIPLSNYGLNGDLILYDSSNNEVARISNYGSLTLNDLVSQINSAFGSENINASLVTNPDGTYTVKIEDLDSPPDNFIRDTSENVLESNTLNNISRIFNTLSPSDISLLVHQLPNGSYTLRLIPEDVSQTVTVSFSGTSLGNFSTRNVFQLIGDLRDKLLNGLAPDASDLMAVQRSYDKISLERSKSGSILAQVRNLEDVQENRMDTLRKMKSDEEEVELSESIMEYTRYRIAYDALMRIVSDARELTILRYL